MGLIYQLIHSKNIIKISTDSSVISMDSSFSLQSDNNSMSMDLRGSIESNQDTGLAHAIRSQSNPRAN